VAPDRIPEEWVVERLDTLWPAHLDGFARLLAVLRGQFDGDLDTMLILLAVSSGTEKDDWRATLFGAAEPPRRTSPTNAQSIALSTGIPRETVRRKLARLQTKGWIGHDAAGNWVTTARASEDLRPSTLATILYFRTILGAALDRPPGD